MINHRSPAALSRERPSGKPSPFYPLATAARSAGSFRNMQTSEERARERAEARRGEGRSPSPPSPSRSV